MKTDLSIADWSVLAIHFHAHSEIFITKTVISDFSLHYPLNFPHYYLPDFPNYLHSHYTQYRPKLTNFVSVKEIKKHPTAKT